MDFEKFTERARGFIESAQGLALRSNHQQLTPEHLLKVLLDDEEGMASNLIKSAGGRPEEVRQQVEIALAKLPKVQGGSGQVYLAPETARVFDQAQELAKKGRRFLRDGRASAASARHDSEPRRQRAEESGRHRPGPQQGDRGIAPGPHGGLGDGGEFL